MITSWSIILSSLYNNFWGFLWLSRYFILFLILISLGVILDPRFKVKYKVIILLVLSYLFIYFLYSLHDWKKDDIFFLWIIKDIFWFTLLLNGSFIIHICLLDWLYQLSKYIKKDFLSFLITRLSFIFSLSFFYYFLDMITYNRFVRDYQRLSIYLIFSVLVYFMNLFNNYSLYLITNKKFKYSLRSFLILLISFIISYFILGITRLYFIWICSSLWGLSEIFLFNYREGLRLKKKNPLSYALLHYTAQLHTRYYNSLSDLLNSYVYLNSPGFSSDFTYFLDYHSTMAMRGALALKHPFIYYPPEILWMILLRYEIKINYEWEIALTKDDLLDKIIYLFKSHNYYATEKQLSEFYSKSLIRFRKLLNLNNLI